MNTFLTLGLSLLLTPQAQGAECAPYVDVHMPGYDGDTTSNGGFVGPNGQVIKYQLVQSGGRYKWTGPGDHTYMTGPDTAEFQAKCNRLSLDLVKSFCEAHPGGAFSLHTRILDTQRLRYGASIWAVKNIQAGTTATLDEYGYVLCNDQILNLATNTTEKKRAKRILKAKKKAARVAKRLAKKRARAIRRGGGTSPQGWNSVANANLQGADAGIVRFNIAVPGSHYPDFIEVPVKALSDRSVDVDDLL